MIQRMRHGWLFAVAALLGCSSSDFSINGTTDSAVTEDGALADTSVADTLVIDDDSLPSPDVSISPCAPPAGDLYVSPSGFDDGPGNGAAGCPFKTIQRALAAVKPTTARIVLSKGFYGGSCTGGPPCDPSPIVVPATITTGLSIVGDGPTNEVIVQGDDVAVFDVRVGGIGFESLTVNPLKRAVGGLGGTGILFSGAAAGAFERATKNIVVSGSAATDGVAGTGAAINVRGTAQPIIGPNVTLSGGLYGLLVQGDARPRIVGDPAAPVTFKNFGGACVRVAPLLGSDKPSISVNAGSSAPACATFEGCGGAAALVFDVPGGASLVLNVLINRGLSGSGGVVVRGAHALTMSGATINDAQSTGILVTDAATLFGGRNSVTNAAGPGLLVSGTAAASLDSFTSHSNAGDGAKCEGSSKLKLGASSLLMNKGNGLYVAGGCTADLATAANTYNKTSARNALAGLCFGSTATPPMPSSSNWSCNRTVAGCVTTSADATIRGTFTNGSPCAANVDISELTAGSIAAVTYTTCCY